MKVVDTKCSACSHLIVSVGRDGLGCLWGGGERAWSFPPPLKTIFSQQEAFVPFSPSLNASDESAGVWRHSAGFVYFFRNFGGSCSVADT